MKKNNKFFLSCFEKSLDARFLMTLLIFSFFLLKNTYDNVFNMKKNDKYLIFYVVNICTLLFSLKFFLKYLKFEQINVIIDFKIKFFLTI